MKLLTKSLMVAAVFGVVACGDGSDSASHDDQVAAESSDVLEQQAPKFPKLPGFGDGGMPTFPGFPGGEKPDPEKIKELIAKLREKLPQWDGGVHNFPSFPGGDGKTLTPEELEAKFKEFIEKLKKEFPELPDNIDEIIAKIKSGDFPKPPSFPGKKADS